MSFLRTTILAILTTVALTVPAYGQDKKLESLNEIIKDWNDEKLTVEQLEREINKIGRISFTTRAPATHYQPLVRSPRARDRNPHSRTYGRLVRKPDIPESLWIGVEKPTLSDDFETLRNLMGGMSRYVQTFDSSVIKRWDKDHGVQTESRKFDQGEGPEIELSGTVRLAGSGTYGWSADDYILGTVRRPSPGGTKPLWLVIRKVKIKELK